MITREQVDDWLEDYIRAWRSYDRGEIGRLFSVDIEYRYHPWDEPLVGRDAVVAGWMENRDIPDTYDASYRTIAVDGSVAVATGASIYRVSPTDTTVDRIYDNCFVMEFDDEGLCRRFTEWFMQRP